MLRYGPLLYYVGRRNVSTGLASAFNKLHIESELKRDAFYTRTGLFGVNQLQSPEGFHLLRDNAIERANHLVEEIIKPKPQANVVALFDELSNSLCQVADLAEFIRVGHSQTRFRATAEQASVAISNLVERLNTDTRLYKSLKNAQLEDSLDKYVAELFLQDFEQSGIHLDDHKRKFVLQLNETILKLSSIFAANANQARLVKTNDLPEKVRGHFPNSSGRTHITGLYADSENELVREVAYRIYLSRDETQNDILNNLLRCRLQLAKLCGFESYAHRAIKGSIVKSPEVVKEFLDILNDRIRGLAEKDYSIMRDIKLRENKPTSHNKDLKAWDVPYYSANHKRGTYNESITQCLPYFSVGVCMDGLNMIFNKLYGVKMQVDSHANGEMWHNDVIKLSIIDEESNEVLGYIYCDLFERQNKQNQDCHHTIRGGCYLRDGTYQLPIVVLVLSLPDSDNNNSPSMLSPAMVDNLFHEMGHAMHSMMARTKYQHITGTRCSTDLAEVPSILMEFFASDPRVVTKFARHHSTGESIPHDLMKRWLKSKKVFIASETQLQVFYSALDQAYHSSDIKLETQEEQCNTTTEILKKIQKQYYSIPYVDDTAWQLRFSHLVGYGAKYYSYLVSRAVASAIWVKLFAADPLSRTAGEIFKREVLALGGGKPARSIAEGVLNREIDAEFIANNVLESFKQPVDCD